MVDDHDLEIIENEAALIKDQASSDFRLIAVKVDNWNTDLSPWEAPPVFGNESFGSGAADTLEEVLNICDDSSKAYYIGGYSLAGLFALWTAYQTDIFQGVAAASPSIWFPGFTDYMKTTSPKTRFIYLSLGDREARTRNPVMATVADRITEANDILKSQGILCTLEWNQGNHFKDADKRTARAFSWILNKSGDLSL